MFGLNNMNEKFNNQEDNPNSNISRRLFLKSTASILAGGLLSSCLSNKPNNHRNVLPHQTTTTSVTEISKNPEYDPANTAWNYDFTKLPNGPLPTDFWNFEIGTKVPNYNNEAQAYTNKLENVRIQNGELIIEALQKNYDGKNFTSAQINTYQKFSFLYGSLEVEMMLPKGIGTWPAAWLLPRDNIYSQNTPGVNKNNKYRWAINGEIDFMETIGRLKNQNWPAAHSYASWNSPGEGPAIFTHVSNAYSSFHKYGVIKTPDSISFTLDGETYATINKKNNNPLDWPFNQPYYLILDLALGGNWAGGDSKYPPYGIDTSTGPWKLITKSIQYKPL